MEKSKDVCEKKISIRQVIDLCNKYGSNTTLGDLAKKVKGDKIWQCPMCAASGLVEEEYLDDYSHVLRTRCVECPTCGGEGWINKHLKARAAK